MRPKVFILITLLVVGCSSPDKEIYAPPFVDAAPMSIIVGDLVEEKHIGDPPCPENMLCLTGIYTNSLGEIETLSGPEIRDSQFKILKHTEWPESSVLALVVQKGKDGAYWVRSRSPVFDDRFCFETESIKGVDISNLKSSPAKGFLGKCFTLK
jgi:hypothetical protein